MLSGAFQANPWYGTIGATGVIWSACYLLWMYQRVFYGEVGEKVRQHIPDFSAREWACVIPLVLMMVWMGVYSQTFMPEVSEASSTIIDESKMIVPLRAALPPASLPHRGAVNAR